MNVVGIFVKIFCFFGFFFGIFFVGLFMGLLKPKKNKWAPHYWALAVWARSDSEKKKCPLLPSFEFVQILCLPGFMWRHDLNMWQPST